MTSPFPARSPNHPLQVAVHQLLIGDATLAGLVSGVWYRVPEGTQFPYVRLVMVTSVPDNDHSGFGRQVNIEAHVWDHGPSNVAMQAIAARVGELLDHREADLNVVGHRVVSIRNEFEQELPDPDPQIRHHVTRFRIITDQEES